MYQQALSAVDLIQSMEMHGCVWPMVCTFMASRVQCCTEVWIRQQAICRDALGVTWLTVQCGVPSILVPWLSFTRVVEDAPRRYREC